MQAVCAAWEFAVLVIPTSGWEPSWSEKSSWMTVVRDGALESSCTTTGAWRTVCRQREWGPLVAIPFWMLILDQEGTDSLGQIAFFPFFFSDLLRLIKSSRRFLPWALGIVLEYNWFLGKCQCVWGFGTKLGLVNSFFLSTFVIFGKYRLVLFLVSQLLYENVNKTNFLTTFCSWLVKDVLHVAKKNGGEVCFLWNFPS